MDAEKPNPSSHTEHSSRQPPPRCTHCNAKPTKDGRNLVVCIDGTSNEFGDHNTNVVKLFRAIDPKTTHPKQRTYYSSGIGTDMASGSLEQVYEMATAWTVGKFIKETYSWLVQEYQEGDQIYLFGFSRGAYQVRVLAGMIHEVGLIRTLTPMQVTKAYDSYEAAQQCDPEARRMAREFKTTFSWTDLRVHFVGVWDTVCSVIKGNLLKGRSPDEHACHFRHALAFDERRAQFKPEYLHEVKSKHIVTSADPEYTASPTSKWPKFTMSDSKADFSLEKRKAIADIKEVWFAGSHSDVGGVDRSGKSHAGNVSLMWMRREAAASGLVLQPTDVVWVSDDIDLGINNSMVGLWIIYEGFYEFYESSIYPPPPRPRRFIPGQKVHASILYANAYSPRASFGNDCAIPVIHSGPDVGPKDQIWETGLFDDTAAEELMAHLDGPQAAAPAYLDMLLFMLRSSEGKHCIRNVRNWKDRLLDLIKNGDCEPFMRLGAAAAYYEAFCDSNGNSGAHTRLLEETFDNDDMKNSLRAILVANDHWNRSRAIALLRPLTQHQVLSERILTEDILKSLWESFDAIIERPDENFVQVMDGLTFLLQCEGTRGNVIEKLDTNPPFSDATRLSLILEKKDSSLLTAALRMLMTLARTTKAGPTCSKPTCSKVKTRLRQLVETRDRLVGPLSAEILLTLHDPNEQEQLNILTRTRVHSLFSTFLEQMNIPINHVRANLAEALVRLIQDRRDSADQEGRGRPVLSRLFGVGNAELTERQKMFIQELKNTVQCRSTRERTAATLTVLELCESNVIRTFLCEIGLLDVLVDQMDRTNGALLAAHALATCLEYDNMKEAIKDNELLPESIVNMIQSDSFHGDVHRVEGFRILRGFMQHADLREKIKNCDITEVLRKKLAKGLRTGVQTSLICLDILRSFDKDDLCASELVAKSLEYLRNPGWKSQKVGVTILSALAQIDTGVAAINPMVCEIIEMLLPKHSIQPIVLEKSAENATLTGNKAQVRPAAATDAPSRPPSSMMGPVWTLRILALNGKLRQTMHNSSRYDMLKNLSLSGKLFDERDTSYWDVHTPSRADVVHMCDKMIKAVDQKQEGLMSVGDAVLPNISHWDRLGMVVLQVTGLLLLIFISVLVTGAYIAISIAFYPIFVLTVLISLIIAGVITWRNSRKTKKLRAARLARAAQAKRESDTSGTTNVHIEQGGDGDPDPHNSERSSRWWSGLLRKRERTTDAANP